jgi:transketolase
MEEQTTSKRHLRTSAIRVLTADAVEKAKSGHPGAPLGLADIAEVLWHDHLRHNPLNPQWPNRDRFILSNGHASMLLYALLHLTGYALKMDDLRQFRQLHAKTPGHPEYGVTPGVETTTGPLGQGLANAVGMAIAERWLAKRFNREHYPLFDYYTHVVAGDGCLMEGISHEACSLAGTLKLGKLIVFYDSNGISIDGDITHWFDEEVALRFRAYHWQVIGPIDGHDAKAIDEAICKAKEELTKPSIIICHTVIGRGASSKEGTAHVHGAPLGAEEIAALRQALDWPYAPFEIPQAVYDAFDAKSKGQALEKAWQEMLQAYAKDYPDLSRLLHRLLERRLPDDWPLTKANLIAWGQNTTPVATRKASQEVLEMMAEGLPELIGGSADLTPSNLTTWHGSIPLHEHQNGNYIHYGVREHAMAAIENGLALSGLIPYGGTFLVFSDYCRSAIRLAALMRQKVIFVLTHDSIGVGEDGPTHQPIEHLSSLRLIPGLDVWRPANRIETAAAWIAAIEAGYPTVLALSRQEIAAGCAQATVDEIAQGGYIYKEATDPDSMMAIIAATGSEVALALEVQERLQGNGMPARVVSIPCLEAFKRAGKVWQDKVLPFALPTFIIEAGNTALWQAYAGRDGRVFGIDTFGESAPAKDLYRHFGLTADHVATAIIHQLETTRSAP